jgi:hypothetical protein
MSRNSEAGLRETPIYFQVLADRVHVDPSDAADLLERVKVEHAGDSPIGNFLDHFYSPQAGEVEADEPDVHGRAD